MTRFDASLSKKELFKLLSNGKVEKLVGKTMLIVSIPKNIEVNAKIKLEHIVAE